MGNCADDPGTGGLVGVIFPWASVVLATHCVLVEVVMLLAPSGLWVRSGIPGKRASGELPRLWKFGFPSTAASELCCDMLSDTAGAVALKPDSLATSGGIPLGTLFKPYVRFCGAAGFVKVLKFSVTDEPLPL